MTLGEQHRVIGEAFLERKETRRALTCLKAKAAKWAQQLESVASVLRGEATATTHSGGGFCITADLPRMLGENTKHVPYPSEQDISTLMADIAETAKRVEALEQQLDQS